MKVLAIVGPTATGKSNLSIEVAKKVPSEIVSADSMLIYKGMDIATAKPKLRTREKYRHHFIDIVSICESYNLATYQEEAQKVINDIIKRGKLPIVVGGTGLYIKALLYGMTLPEHDNDTSLRSDLERQLEEKGLEYLVNKLKELDIEAYKLVDKNNSRRVIRAIEIIEGTKKPYLNSRKEWSNYKPQYDMVLIGLMLDRELLYERINERVDEMIDGGLVNETRTLIKNGIKEEKVASQALGYKEIIGYLDGNLSLDEAVDLLKRRTRKFAKRQLTWFKKDPNIEWYDIQAYTIEEIADKLIKKIDE